MIGNLAGSGRFDTWYCKQWRGWHKLHTSNRKKYIDKIKLKIYDEDGKLLFFGHQFNATHTLITHFNNIWTRNWNFCGWSFHSPLNCWRRLHDRNITEQCMTDRPSNHLQQAILSVNWYAIVFLHLFLWFYFWHSFPIHSSCTNSVKNFVKKLDDKG